jgi:hypothetical protein
VRPTELRGRSRGSRARLYDIRRHPECYLLLCRLCHRQLDAGAWKPEESLLEAAGTSPGCLEEGLDKLGSSA